MTLKLRSHSAVAPQALHASSTGPHVGPVSGREGKGREEEWKNQGRSPHASLQTVEAQPAPIGQTATNQSASMHGDYVAGELA